ncbi:MAG: FHA domain-containing protein [Cystobacterineae bacterium]|nr:FHA domain-containing protein [Cystobacterineae bacterium]
MPELFALAKENPLAEANAPHLYTNISPEEQNTQPLFLLIDQGPAAGQAFQIVQGSCITGRASNVDLCLKHPSVSRRHAQLKRLGDHLYVRDLGSQNGTYVNQQRIVSETEVFAGDSIIIGTSLLRIKDSLSLEDEPLEEMLPDKPAAGVSYYTVLVTSLTASLTTLLAMVLLKLFFYSPASSIEAPIMPAPPSSEPPTLAFTLPSEAPWEVPPPNPMDALNAPLKTPAEKAPQPQSSTAPEAPAPSPPNTLEAFQMGFAENALQQAREAKQVLLAEQLTAFLPKWKTAENAWEEVSSTKPSTIRPALAAQEEALLAAIRISADSHYSQELKTRIASLKKMAPKKPAAPPKTPRASSPGTTAPGTKQPASSSKALQEKRRAIDKAFGDF